MSVVTDAQAESATNGAVETAARAAAPALVPGSHAAAVQTFSTGVGKQIDAKRDAYLYVNVTTAAALTVAMGPTSAAATVLNASESDALGMITLFVPGGWYVKLTGTLADVTCTSVLV